MKDATKTKQPKGLSTERRKRYIVENSNVLNRETKIAILNITMMEVGQSVIMETNNKKDIDINLDLLETKNVEILNHIYNIVKKRLDTLNSPVKNSVNDILM
jgi:hypothetical protein